MPLTRDCSLVSLRRFLMPEELAAKEKCQHKTIGDILPNLLVSGTTPSNQKILTKPSKLLFLKADRHKVVLRSEQRIFLRQCSCLTCNSDSFLHLDPDERKAVRIWRKKKLQNLSSVQGQFNSKQQEHTQGRCLDAH